MQNVRTLENSLRDRNNDDANLVTIVARARNDSTDSINVSSKFIFVEKFFVIYSQDIIEEHPSRVEVSECTLQVGCLIQQKFKQKLTVLPISYV